MSTPTGHSRPLADEAAIREQIEEIVLKMAPAGGGTLSPDTRLVEDLGYYSLRLFELSMVVEARFGVELPPEDTMVVSTVADLRALITRLLQARADGPRP
jgi:acyl carrier protein